ncbi:MAG: helix-turn-helix transcriptional regulator [Desulfosoma sp.]|uniref:helix-turn-helix transcriptional regulator n=1 Tax=Desulfosoma sp. TaxID=2603217 RepID=UPI00404B431F
MASGYFQQLSKLLQVVDCLAKPQGAGLKELREVLECDERTVYRWIDTIQHLGFPLEEVQGQNPKSYRLIKSYVKKLPNIAIPNFDLSLSDIILIHVVLSQDRVTLGTQMKSRIENLLRRLRAYLSDDDQRRVEALERLAILNPRPQKDYSQKENIIECLTNAILQKKRCLVKYYSFHKKKEYRFPIHPLHFFESQGGLYVMVQLAEMKNSMSCVVDTLRVLAVERIQEITLLKETFEYPEGLNPYELLSQAFDVVWNDPVEAKI